MNTKQIIEFCWEIAPEIVKKYDYEVLEIKFVKEFGNDILEILVDGLYGPVNIEYCQEISKLIGKDLDEKINIKDEYFLEVASAGIERPFDKYRDFEKNIGRKVEVKFFEELNGIKEIIAKLISHDDDKVCLEIKNKKYEFNKREIETIKLSLF